MGEIPWESRLPWGAAGKGPLPAIAFQCLAQATTQNWKLRLGVMGASRSASLGTPGLGFQGARGVGQNKSEGHRSAGVPAAGVWSEPCRERPSMIPTSGARQGLGNKELKRGGNTAY